jgi:5-methylcytosine-specific restriction endonuclease McrA
MAGVVPAKWINKRRRARIYARDGWRCVYCEATKGSTESELLSLDHLQPRCKLGANSSGNLVTACKSCNSARGARSVRSFCIAVAEYTRQDWRVVLARVKAAARRVVPAEANTLGCSLISAHDRWVVAGKLRDPRG